MSAAFLIAMLAWEGGQVVRLGVLSTDEDQQRLRIPPEWAGRALPPQAIVFSKEFSGALLHYSDHQPVRWDLAPPDRALTFARSSERPVFALLMDFEEKPFRARYGAAFRKVRTFDGGAVFVME